MCRFGVDGAGCAVVLTTRAFFVVSSPATDAVIHDYICRAPQSVFIVVSLFFLLICFCASCVFLFLLLSVVNIGVPRSRALFVHVLLGRPRDCLSLRGGLGRPDGDIGEIGNDYEYLYPVAVFETLIVPRKVL